MNKLYFQVRPKYLQCVAISCLYIAAKTLEEDEVSAHTVKPVLSGHSKKEEQRS